MNVNNSSDQLDPWGMTGLAPSNALPMYNPQPGSAGPSRQSSGGIAPLHNYIDPQVAATSPAKQSSDPIIAFLSEMPSAADNPTRVAIWTELVRFKTRTLELQIAEAKRKEKEAELELARFKEMTAGGANRTPAAAPMPLAPAPAPSLGNYGPPAANPLIASQIYPYYHKAQQAFTLPQSVPQQVQQQSNVPLDQTLSQNNLTPHPFLPPQSMTPFDLHAITENFDDMFNWMPDFDQDGNLINAGGADLGIAPSALQLPEMHQQPMYGASPISRSNSDLLPTDVQTPVKRRPSSVADSLEDEQPTTKKSKRGGKKVTVEVLPACSVCKKPMGKVLVRAPSAEMPDEISAAFLCIECLPVKRPPPVGGDAGLGGPAIGTVETRKRQRMGMETEDEERKVKERRQFCDVCQRIIGSGQVKGGKENVGYLAEVICHSCDAKYQR